LTLANLKRRKKSNCLARRRRCDKFAISLHPPKVHFSARGLIRGVVALPVILSLLAILILAASPGLHARWHKDAGGPNHQCAVTLLTQQHLTPAAPPLVFLPEPRPRAGSQRLETTERYSAVFSLLPPERGPPSPSGSPVC
jgi:hypothetical protein